MAGPQVKDGWIKLHRSALENGWLRNHKLWAFWCYCLLKASHKEHSFLVVTQKVALKPGQFLFGLLKASQDTGLTVRSVRTCLKTLISTNSLSIKTTNKYSIGTIENWAFYQSAGNKSDILNDKESDTRVLNKRQKSDNIQECKNGKNGKNKGNFDFVTEDAGFISKLKDLYPGIDFNKEVRDMRAWLLSNPPKKDYYRFVTNWIRRASERKVQTEGPLKEDPIDRHMRLTRIKDE